MSRVLAAAALCLVAAAAPSDDALACTPVNASPTTPVLRLMCFDEDVAHLAGRWFVESCPILITVFHPHAFSPSHAPARTPCPRCFGGVSEAPTRARGFS